MAEHHISGKQRFVFMSFTTMIVFLIIIVLGELIIRISNPQRTMIPRREFSPEYGFINYKNTKRIHETRGKWRFVYTTNQYRNRGKTVSISNRYDIPNIVILGDSYSFGIGVNDGEEYAAIMANIIKDRYNVTNLSVGGWGLTQQIRRYYEFGQLYFPEIVLLQFSGNDLEDNFNNQVTVIENGKFKFIDSKSPINWIKKYLSNSFIQRSQIYNLFRDSVYIYFKKKNIEATQQSIAQGLQSNKVLIKEQFYNALLELFAKDLNRKGVRLLMISVGNQLDRAPHVKEKVFDLDSRGLLDYIEVKDFFAGITNYSSPEGHSWGKKAHQILGGQLSERILNIQ